MLCTTTKKPPSRSIFYVDFKNNILKHQKTGTQILSADVLRFVRQIFELKLGLSTSCSRFSKTFPVTSQTVAQKLLRKQSKDAYCKESCSKVARRTKNFFCSDDKLCKIYKKDKISKHYSAILPRNQRCQITLSSIKSKKCNEPTKLFNDLLHPRYSSQSSVNLRSRF